jgi:anaerobic ribonucleoside-triphosphate reductase activating protein
LIFRYKAFLFSDLETELIFWLRSPCRGTEIYFIGNTFVIQLSPLVDKCGSPYQQEPETFLAHWRAETAQVISGKGVFMELNIAAFVPSSTSNGPGKRAVVWVQGCPFRCPGCFNHDFQPFDGGYPLSPPALADKITVIDGIEGVTFSGGEPFCQAGALAEAGRILKKQGLNVVTFTGLTYREIQKKRRNSWDSLIRETDLLIAGRYDCRLPARHPLLSSSNQELVHISPQLEGRVRETGTEVEYIIGCSGEITVSGFPVQGRFRGREGAGNKPCHIFQG